MDGLTNMLKHFGLDESFLKSKEFEETTNNLLAQIEAEERKIELFQAENLFQHLRGKEKLYDMIIIYKGSGESDGCFSI